MAAPLARPPSQRLYIWRVRIFSNIVLFESFRRSTNSLESMCGKTSNPLNYQVNSKQSRIKINSCGHVVCSPWNTLVSVWFLEKHEKVDHREVASFVLHQYRLRPVFRMRIPSIFGQGLGRFLSQHISQVRERSIQCKSLDLMAP